MKRHSTKALPCRSGILLAVSIALHHPCALASRRHLHAELCTCNAAVVDAKIRARIQVQLQRNSEAAPLQLCSGWLAVKSHPCPVLLTLLPHHLSAMPCASAGTLQAV